MGFRHNFLMKFSKTYKKVCKNEELLQDILNELNDVKNLSISNNANKTIEKIFDKIVITTHVNKCFGYGFKEYFIKNNMPLLIEKLKRNLDEKSINVIDNKINGFLNFPPYTEDSRVCRFRADSRDILYTQEEIEERGRYLDNLLYLQNKYKGNFPDEKTRIPEVFFYHHGLKFLDDKTLKYIEGKDFLDIGASFGDSSIVLANYKPNRIFAMEMLPSIEKIYYSNIELNNLDASRFKFVNCGVSNKISKIKIRDDNNSGNLGTAGDVEINLTTIDDFVEKNNCNVGLIKMDIEGAEVDAIHGAIKTIKKFRPLMTITIYHTPTQFFELKPFIEDLNLNYKFIIRNLNFITGFELETTLIGIPNNE